MGKKLEENQLVLCTVKQIVGTIVFVSIDEYNLEGTITFSEIFPGKIRNIRDFVFPGKKIVCKVLRITPEVIELSLRRVKVNERNEFNELHKKEKNYLAMLRTVLGEKTEAIIQKIKKSEESLVDFIESAKENAVKLEKYISREHVDRIFKILAEKKTKEVSLDAKFSLSSKAPNGIIIAKKIIRESLEPLKDSSEASYIAAGKYMIKIKSKNPKTADQQLRKIIGDIESLAKKNACVFQEEKK